MPFETFVLKQHPDSPVGALIFPESCSLVPGSATVVYPAVSILAVTETMASSGPKQAPKMSSKASQGGGRGGRGGQRCGPGNTPRLSAHGEKEEAFPGDARSARLRPRARQRVS